MKVSIIIPTFNYARYIFDALKSIEEQDYPKELIEVIIVDDGSTDETPVLFKNYAGPLNINYHYQENAGKAAATQKGIDLSNGDVLFNLDADDYFYPSKIKTIINIYKKYPLVNYVAHPAQLIENGIDIGKENIPEILLNKCLDGDSLLTYFLKHRILFGGGSTFSAKSTQLKTNRIPYHVNMYIDEYLIFEACNQTKVYLHDKALSVWRIHQKNYSVNKESGLYLKSKNDITASVAMLNYLEKVGKNKKIINLYALKHWDRYINFKEKFEKKTFKDFLKTLIYILSFNYSLKVIYRYRMHVRLFPAYLVKFLKSKRFVA